MKTTTKAAETAAPTAAFRGNGGTLKRWAVDKARYICIPGNRRAKPTARKEDMVSTVRKIRHSPKGHQLSKIKEMDIPNIY